MDEKGSFARGGRGGSDSVERGWEGGLGLICDNSLTTGK